MRLSLVLVASVLLTASANAGPKLTLDQVMAKALAGPRVQMAKQDAAAAAARVDEADAARMPRIKATLFGTVSPEITCIDKPQCTQTDPQNFDLRFDGVFGGGQIDVTQPLFTFGKIAHARRAARAGVAAQNALADEAAGDLAVDAARAYWGVKVARELGFWLDDGIEQIQKAIVTMNQRTGADKPSIQDIQRVTVLLAEAKVQRAEAAAAEQQALAGLRALTGIRDADVDDAPFEKDARAVPTTSTGDGRPQKAAATQGAAAADELAKMAASYYFPDLAIVATGYAAKAQGVDNPPSAFANDNFNRAQGGIVLALQWTIEPWNVRARVAKAQADARRAHAQSDLAAIGARYDADLALAELAAAKAKLDAAADGERAGKTWVSSVVQGMAIGTTESKDLADAYIAWFGMKARLLQATFQYNVALARVGRAGGEFHAPGKL
jgi:outer membrane protein TolC